MSGQHEHLIGIQQIWVGRIHQALAIHLDQRSPVADEVAIAGLVSRDRPEGISRRDDDLMRRGWHRWGRRNDHRRRGGRGRRSSGGRGRLESSVALLRRWWSCWASGREAPSRPYLERRRPLLRGAPAPRGPRSPRAPPHRAPGFAGSADCTRRPTTRLDACLADAAMTCRPLATHSQALATRAPSRTITTMAVPAPRWAYHSSRTAQDPRGGAASDPEPAKWSARPASSETTQITESRARPFIGHPPRRPAQGHRRAFATRGWGTRRGLWHWSSRRREAPSRSARRPAVRRPPTGRRRTPRASMVGRRLEWALHHTPSHRSRRRSPSWPTRYRLPFATTTESSAGSAMRRSSGAATSLRLT